MSHTLTKQALPRLSDEQRADLICKACTASKGTALGAIGSQLYNVAKELERLEEQLTKLEQPGGDRVMARMVKGRVDDGKRIAQGLLRKATQTEGYNRDDAYLRLILAENADRFSSASNEVASTLQRIALDELLQTSA